jgi:hypothetical protein
MFQFDRAGTDVVMYQFENPDMCDMLESMGFVVGLGSFSDIAWMDELGCKGFNFGTGYDDNHGRMSHMFIRETCAMVAKFVRFYRKYRDVYMEHIYSPNGIGAGWSAYQGSGYSRGWPDEDTSDTAWHGGQKYVYDATEDDWILDTSLPMSPYANGLRLTGQRAEDIIGRDILYDEGWEADCQFCGRMQSVCDYNLCDPMVAYYETYGDRGWVDNCDMCDGIVESVDPYFLLPEGDLLCEDCGREWEKEIDSRLIGHNGATTHKEEYDG